MPVRKATPEETAAWLGAGFIMPGPKRQPSSEQASASIEQSALHEPEEDSPEQGELRIAKFLHDDPARMRQALDAVRKLRKG